VSDVVLDRDLLRIEKRAVEWNTERDANSGFEIIDTRGR
jgi:hypothetical protein